MKEFVIGSAIGATMMIGSTALDVAVGLAVVIGSFAAFFGLIWSIFRQLSAKMDDVGGEVRKLEGIISDLRRRVLDLEDKP